MTATARSLRPTKQDVLSWFGHDYEVDGRTEWHSLNCLYRKTWAMGGTDENACIVARAFLASAPESEIDVERLARALRESNLIHRYVDYAEKAGVPKDSEGRLADNWAEAIAAAYREQGGAG